KSSIIIFVKSCLLKAKQRHWNKSLHRFKLRQRQQGRDRYCRLFECLASDCGMYVAAILFAMASSHRARARRRFFRIADRRVTNPRRVLTLTRRSAHLREFAQPFRVVRVRAVFLLSMRKWPPSIG